MVDLSLVLDVSSSIGWRWPAVRDASRTFVQSFDAANDRMALATYGNGARGAGPDAGKPGVQQARHGQRPFRRTCRAAARRWWKGCIEAGTSCAPWPNGQQSGLRVIVLFTDGASNSVPGFYDVAPGVARGLRTYDFPKNLPDPDSQTWNNPTIQGLYDTDTGVVSNPSYVADAAQLEQYQHHRRGPVAAAHERAHAPSQRGHSDAVPAAGQCAQGQRRRADGGSRASAVERRARSLSGADIQHQQRGAESSRDHR